jgi:GNAT superfamily N-acetyltransferase
MRFYTRRVDALEQIELAALLDFFAAAPPDVSAELDLAVLELDEGAALSVGAEPKPLLFNRALGLADEGALSELEHWSRSRDCPLAVSLRPGSELQRHLSERGYERGQTLMKFRRDTQPPPAGSTALRVTQLGEEHAASFGALATDVFGMPAPMARWLAALWGREGWICFGAFDDDGLVATGAAYAAGGHAWLGIAATLPRARGRGAQSAILAARVEAAAGAGARALAVETGDRVDGQPGPSFRNILRAGFEEAFRQQWWLRP